MKTATILLTAVVVLSSPMVVAAGGAAAQGINGVDLDFQGAAALIINTAGKSPSLSFVFADDVIPDANNELRFRKLKPYLFHVKHRNWQHHYQINTSRREVYRVTGGKFGKMGGRLETIGNLRVNTAGDSGGGVPNIIYLNFAHAGISYRRDRGLFLIFFIYTVGAAPRQEFIIHETTEWQLCAQSSHLYHVKVPGWVDHWLIDTQTGQLYRVIGTQFCRPAGRQLPLAAGVRVY
jgi:hypothetical protein